MVIDSDPVWLSAVERGLRAYGFREVKVAATLASAWQLFSGDENVIVTEVVVAHEVCFSFVSRALQRRALPVIAMSERAPRPQVFRLHEYGVKAYLEKPFATPALHDCLEALGRSHLGRHDARESVSGGVAEPVLEDVLHRFRAQYRLTNAEIDVLRALVKGLRRTDVARDRCISVNTVKTQVRSLLSKSGAASIRMLRRELAEELRRSSMSRAG